MAVQQNKKSRSRRGMRRAHDSLSGPTLLLMRSPVKYIVATT